MILPTSVPKAEDLAYHDKPCYALRVPTARTNSRRTQQYATQLSYRLKEWRLEILDVSKSYFLEAEVWKRIFAGFPSFRLAVQVFDTPRCFRVADFSEIALGG